MIKTIASKTTSLQIPLNQSDREIAEIVTQEILGLSLGSTIKMIVKIIAQKKEIPLNINLSQEFDETTWLINNPGYGQRLLDSVNTVNHLIAKNKLGKSSILKHIKESEGFVTFDSVKEFEHQKLRD